MYIVNVLFATVNLQDNANPVEKLDNVSYFWHHLSSPSRISSAAYITAGRTKPGAPDIQDTPVDSVYLFSFFGMDVTMIHTAKLFQQAHKHLKSVSLLYSLWSKTCKSHRLFSFEGLRWFFAVAANHPLHYPFGR
jgi:hypothetical protein